MSRPPLSFVVLLCALCLVTAAAARADEPLVESDGEGGALFEALEDDLDPDPEPEAEPTADEPLRAAGGDAEGSQAESAPRDIESIVVTAQRREASLQETNLSLTVLNEEELLLRGAEGLADLTEFIPNVNFNTNASGNGLFITTRGISLADSTLISRDSPIAIYIDGVYWGITIGNLISILDISRVEVLRGPQGDLYGRNASAGAINIITNKPSGFFSTRVRSRYGSRGRGDLRLLQEFPIFGGEGIEVDERFGTLSGSLSFASIHRDPLRANDFGPDVHEQERLAGRGALRYELDAFTADVIVDYSYAHEQGNEMQLTFVDESIVNPPSTFPTSLAFAGGLLALPPVLQGSGGVDIRPFAARNRRGHLDIDGPSEAGGGLRPDKTRSLGAAAILELDLPGLPWLGDAALKSTTGFRQLWSRTASDFDGTPFDLFSQRRRDRQWQATQELALSGSTSNDLFSLDYNAGYFFFAEQGRTQSATFRVKDPAFDSILVIGTTPLEFTDRGRSVYQRPEIDNQAHAVYLHLALTPALFDERLSFEFGFRSTWEDRGIASTSVTIDDEDGIARTTIPSGTDTSRSFQEITPSGRIGFWATDDLNTYVSISKGYLAGGFNARANSTGTGSVTDLENAYDEETVVSYEAGFKWRGFDRRVSLDGTGFFADYRDLQRTTIVDVTPPGDPAGTDIAPGVINADRAEIWGAEIELVAEPIDGLVWNAAYGYTKARYERFVDLIPGASGATRDFANERSFPNVPEHNVSTGLQYEFWETPIGTPLVRLDYYWQSETLLQNGDNPNAGQDAYSLLHGRIALRNIAFGAWGEVDLAIWGRNLLDTDTRPFGIDFIPNSQGALPWVVQFFGEPRTFGGAFIWRLP